jgi:hypothetical protein
MERRRIPNTLGKFDIHIKNVNEHLQKAEKNASIKNGIRLGMTSAELTKYNNLKTKWTSGDMAHPGIYDLQGNPATKNKITREKALKFIKEYSAFFRPILLRMSGSPEINATDRLILCIAEAVTKHTSPIAAIEEDCMVMPVIHGGGTLRISCCTSHESGRPGKPLRANALELAYRIFKPKIDTQTGEIIFPDTAQHANDGTTKLLSTKAVFLLNLGQENCGCRMDLFARWINTKHPHLNGAWKGPVSTFIG